MPMFSLDFGVRKDSGKFSRSSKESIESLSGSLKRTYGQPHYKSAVEASGKLDFGELELELWDSRYMLRGYKEKRPPCWGCSPSCIPISLILIFLSLVVILSLLDQHALEEVEKGRRWLEKEWVDCRASCKLQLVESIPEGLIFNSSVVHPSTHSGWLSLLSLAKERIEIGSFYWNLRDEGIAPEYTEQGRDIYERLLDAGVNRNISIRIAQNNPSPKYPNEDTADLVKARAAVVRSLDFHRLMKGGVLHTKMWVVDRAHIYLGSANFDWKSLTQVKELGILVTHCPCLAKDLAKIFEVYWALGEEGAIVPDKWPSSLATSYNDKSPMNISFNGERYFSYLSSAPAPFSPLGRTFDLAAIKSVIGNASKFIHVSVMDYSPSIFFSHPKKFWPEIDDALRSAAFERNVSVRLLISRWSHTKNSTYFFLRSLAALNEVFHGVSVEIKLFTVPSTPAQKGIPYARVNHNKYMVTDKTAFIGTSNWSGDYFTDTAGVGFIVSPNHQQQGHSSSDVRDDLRQQVEDIFQRDWNSPYASPFP